MKLGNVVVNGGLNQETFVQQIDAIVKEYNIDYMDAVIHFCEKNNIEIETAASIIKSNQRIKSRLQHEAEDLHFLPKRAKLPF